MTIDSPHKSALITGGAIRVGAAMAQALAADGWHVAIHYHGSGAEAEALLAQIQAHGGHGHLVRADLRDPDAVAGLIAAAGRDAPPLCCLINNASLFENDAALNMTQKSWDDHQAVNLRAPVFLARDFARNLAARDLEAQGLEDGAVGVVINLLDNKMFALNPDFFSYTIAKYGLLGATKVLAMELAPRVRVCGIAPGITLPSTNQSAQGFRTAHALNPLGQGSTLEQLVAALRFILAAPALTGEVITIDGGQSLLGLPRDVAFLTED
ncbi:MAG: SDR family oxidoreductase [Alphaproteobacteria bacterium]|nr:SDR family oxidoreductase [Alphaproteobacteria bacterium]